MKCRSCGAEVERRRRWRLSDAHSAVVIGAYGIQAMAYGMWSATTAEQGQSLAGRKKKQSNDGIEEREKRNEQNI